LVLTSTVTIDPAVGAVKVSASDMGRRKKMKSRIGVALALAGLHGCGSSSTFDPVSDVERFVGTWDAVVFTVTADDPPYTVADILTLGPFWIDVEPSGRYLATLEFLGGQVEFGQLTVDSPTQLTLDADAGPPAPSTYVFAAPDSLILDGATQFDFNFDDTDEPAQVHMEIVRR
jgi:hypothetical protein